MAKDPWRIDDPLHGPGPAPKRGPLINLGEDLDDDLKVANSYRFSCRGGSIRINHLDATSQREALQSVVFCLRELWDASMKHHILEEFIAFSMPGRCCGDIGAPATILTTGDEDDVETTLHLVNHDYENGMTRLIRLFKAAERKKPEILKKWGIIPMQR